jgi:preprotein translocase subunit SecA
MRKFAGPRISAMLQKLGLRDGQNIEHRWVTRSVERAQKKVEERNFEIRKRLLEYDEVMNEQRTLVYDHRQQILRGEGLRELVMRMVGQTLDRAVEAACPDDQQPSGWDLKPLQEWFKRRTGRDAPRLEVPDREKIAENLKSALDALYDDRARRYGPELTLLIERFVLLGAFDRNWKEHLYNMDALKSGIGLRAYANEDPKVAYKREGYQLFEEMLRAIEEEVSDKVFRIEVAQPEEAEDLRKTPDLWAGGQARHDEFGSATAEMEAAARQNLSKERPKPFRRDKPKVGRNDPCPCQSGRKFKYCCGRLDGFNGAKAAGKGPDRARPRT